MGGYGTWFIFHGVVLMKQQYLERYYEIHGDFCGLVQAGGASARQMLKYVERDIANIESGAWKHVTDRCLERRLRSLENVYVQLKEFV